MKKLSIRIKLDQCDTIVEKAMTLIEFQLTSEGEERITPAPANFSVKEAIDTTLKQSNNNQKDQKTKEELTLPTSFNNEKAMGIT